MSDRKTFGYLEVEAALCVWEQVNEWTLGDAAKPDDDFRSGWIALRENVGSIELRHQSIALGQWCLQVFDYLNKSAPEFFDGYAYDFEVIPAILAHASKDGKPAIYVQDMPQIENVAAMIAREFLLRDFVTACRIEARGQWEYADLISDHADRTEQAFESGDEPAAFVAWLGNKYDLSPAQ